MTDERKMYLYKEVRPYCRPGMEDLVAPNPVYEFDRARNNANFLVHQGDASSLF